MMAVMTVVPMRTTMMSETSRTRTARTTKTTGTMISRAMMSRSMMMSLRSRSRPETRTVVGTWTTKSGPGSFDVVVWRRVIVATGTRWTEFLEAGVVAHGTGTAKPSWGVVSVVMAMMSGAARTAKASGASETARTSVVTAAGGTVMMMLMMAVHVGWCFIRCSVCSFDVCGVDGLGDCR